MITIKEKLSEIIRIVGLFNFGYCNHIYIMPNKSDHRLGWHNIEMIKAMLSPSDARRLRAIKTCIRNCREDHHSPSEGWIEQTYNIMVTMNNTYHPSERQTTK